ncbi:MAG: hypothetical protein WBS24_17700 [Terriglobales bacterium]
MTIYDHAKFREAAWRVLLPPARDIIFIFLFWSLLAGTLSNRPLADPDIGWHIRTGEQILITHTLPRIDPYSSTMLGQPWFAWEWLYDLALGVLYHFCGLNGVVWLCAVLVASTFTILLSQLLKRGTGLLLAIFLMLLAEAAATIHLFARPHIASWLLVLLWFVALERRDLGLTSPRWPLWFFPASTLLWVNLHGEWVLGFALLAIYIFSAIVESWRSQDPFAALTAAKRARSMGWAGAASALATFANPYGWRLHEHIVRYLTDRYLMDRISEFRSPNFHYWPARCFGVILVLTVFAFASHRKDVRISHILVALLATYIGLLSSRNLPISSMLLVLIIGPMLWGSFVVLAETPGAWGWVRRRAAGMDSFSSRMSAQELHLRGHLWPVLSAIGALLVCLQGGWFGSRHVIHAQFEPKWVPVAAVDFLGNEPSTEPIFSRDSWGGYLIYRLYPKRLVVVDDRHDLYGSNRIRQLLVLMQGEPEWRRALDKLRVRTVLLPAGSTLANLLRELPQEWSVVYEDKLAVVFEKR